jgi:hypothetical protein
MFSPAIYCSSHETAGFVSLLFSKLFSGMIACQGCGILFVPRRRNQRYHEHGCAARHREARYRKRRERIRKAFKTRRKAAKPRSKP